MIKIYAYYNYGGYKDFYIGNIEEKQTIKYFLPLLSVHEQILIENPYDEALKNQVEHQKELPKIVALSDSTADYNYPNQARILMSHSGYKVIYKHLNNEQQVLAIRDIIGPKDTYGRQSPFNMMFIGEGDKDRKLMDIIAEYLRHEISSFENTVNQVFASDFKENGLRCDVGVLIRWLNEIIDKGVAFEYDNNIKLPVKMLIISNNTSLNTSLREQDIRKGDINVCYRIDGTKLFPFDDLLRQEEPCINILKEQREASFHEKHQTEGSNPSLHAMLNVPKREDMEKLWNYIRQLEKRIDVLENKL